MGGQSWFACDFLGYVSLHGFWYLSGPRYAILTVLFCSTAPVIARVDFKYASGGGGQPWSVSLHVSLYKSIIRLVEG